MKEKLAKIIDRFPDRERIIRSLAQSSARFEGLILDHHDAHRRLASAEAEADPARREELESRVRDLEEEMVRLMQGYPLA